MKKLENAIRISQQIPPYTLLVLDWILAFAERLVAIGICAAVLYSGYRFISGKASASDAQSLSTLSQNWKVLLLLLIPLFYPTVKKLVQQAKKIGPYERQDLPGAPGEDEKRD